MSAAESICPERHEALAQQRLSWLKNRLADKDYTSVARGLSAVNLDNFPPALRPELATICLQAAQGLAKTDQPAAQRALDKAFQLAPAEAATEANSLLWIELHPDPTEQKLRRCKDFLTAFPKAERANDVRKAILAVAVRWAEAGKRDEAIELGEWLLENTPDSPLRQQIEEKIAAWRAGPSGTQTPAAAEPADGGKQAELDAKLQERKKTVNTPLEVIEAVQDKEIWIIEVSDYFTGDQFSPRQAKILKDWVSKGGILWANNNVLLLLGIRYSILREAKGLECAAAGKHSIVEGVKTVRLKDLSRGTHSLKHYQAIPLLTSKNRPDRRETASRPGRLFGR